MSISALLASLLWMTDGAQNISSYLLSALSLPDLDCAVLHSASVQITLAETPLPSPPSEDAQSLIYKVVSVSDPSLSGSRVTVDHPLISSLLL